MSDSSNNPKIPNAIIDLLVSDLFMKNGINVEKVKEQLSDEQKQMLKKMVKDLSQQVDSFVNTETTKEKDE